MTLEDLIRALTGREEPQRAPMPQAPARYPGQGITPGALRRDPIPQWVGGVQGPAQERMSVLRTQDGGFRRPVGPGGVTGDEPPLRVPFAALNGPRPSMGTAADWIAGQPPTPPRGPIFRDQQPGDMADWRQPFSEQISSDVRPLAVGETAPQRGLQPPDMEGPPLPSYVPRPDPELAAILSRDRDALERYRTEGQREMGALRRRTETAAELAARIERDRQRYEANRYPEPAWWNSQPDRRFSRRNNRP
jgi:hypothetical protein